MSERQGEIRQRTARQIVDAVSDVCGQNINFIDADGMIIASTDAARVGSFHEIGRRAAILGQVIEVERTEAFSGTQEGINVPIIYHGKVTGVVGISGDPKEVRRYATLARKIAVLLLWERESDLERINWRERMSYRLRCLLGENGETGLDSFLKEFHLQKQARFCTALICLRDQMEMGHLFGAGRDEKELPEQAVYRTLEASGSPYYAFWYPNSYVLLLAAEQRESGRELLRQLAEKYPGCVRIGLGNLQELGRQEQSYREAQLAVESLGAGGGFAVYEEMDLHLLVSGISREVRELFLNKTVGRLGEEDRALLQAYFEEETSLIQTSRRLHLHKNTLQYRLNRIERLCGYDPRTFREAVVLYCGLRLLGTQEEGVVASQWKQEKKEKQEKQADGMGKMTEKERAEAPEKTS